MIRYTLLVAMTFSLVMVSGCGGKLTEEEAKDTVAEVIQCMADGDLSKAEAGLKKLEKSKDSLPEDMQKTIGDMRKKFDVAEKAAKAAEDIKLPGS
ncbi:hypothetical protein LCGC14_0456310 [marine sediment metagenome]|uniref:Lipoprotein n=1 Tax=marine sediment metagenome TaxID=412755 RepID=A0A0F9V347_9ZZZZ|nr:hypothetical protein [Phycisphaerae bacterium]HDZ42899.1 hypothetical protein [Phycisphaerae bacterium]